jgi:beta-glucanase (GH16 family)
MRKTRKASLGLAFVWILLLIGVLAFAPQVSAAEPTSGNLVSNGDFSGGMTGWGWYLAPNAMAYRSIVNGEIYVQIPDDGDATSHIQVNKPNITLVNGRQYALYFDAHSASSTRNIVANVSMMENPWTTFGSQTFNITTTKQRYSFTFTMSQPTQFLSQVSFQVGDPSATLKPGVYLDNVALYDLTGGTVPTPSAMPTPSVSYNTLVWSDEFNGTSVDTSNWTFETGIGMNGWGNQELEYYRSQNATVSSGLLLIQAKKENYRGSSYTSARMKTQGKREFQYGRFEARVKLPYGQGIWPAFWTLGYDIDTVSWPASGEIDILEMVGGGSGGDSSELRDDTIVSSVHYKQADGSHMNKGNIATLGTGIFADGFHTVSMVWDANYIYYFLDGVQYGAQEITSADRFDEFHKKHFILLNLAVGGVWPGYPDQYTVFPQNYYIDYVRVYQ